ncbi:MAG: hypothetical protein KDK22_15635, partial [Rhodobacteraceae bacterium]|nr:hypothetical protein [Paracoccaceae bacterium]
MSPTPRLFVLGALAALLFPALGGAAHACPNPNANGQMLSASSQQLTTGLSRSITAGGGQDLGACPGVPGTGHVALQPDVTLNLTHNAPGRALVLGVNGQCDTVLLVRGPNGQWLFNDDTNGLDPEITIPAAQTGEYDIWVGTFGAQLCGSTLTARTVGAGGGLPLLPQPPVLPVPPVLQPPQLVLCPNPNQNGQALSYSGQQLWVPQSHGVTAGGNADLANCPGVPGHGHVAAQPDFTLTLTHNVPGYDLEFRVDGQCDTVLLVRGPNGQWSYNDDTNGVNPAIRLSHAATGAYDIWVGTFGAQTCGATFTAETFGGQIIPQPPQPPQPAACPDPGQNGLMLTYSSQQLTTAQSHGVTAGGPLDLGACGSVPGHGRIVQGPDFTLNLTHNAPGRDLRLGVDGQCDTVLLVRGPNGQWSYNDDSNGLNPAVVIPSAQVGLYDIWVGTFGAQTCPATLVAETLGNLPQPPQPQPPQPAACPDYHLPGQLLNFAAQDLGLPQTQGVIAGGTLDLAACGSVPGHGYIIQAPDFSMNLTANPLGAGLRFTVNGACDTVMLINDALGQWHYNDDSNGLNPAIDLPQAAVGQYDIWVGTFGSQTCQATMAVQAVGGQPPPQPPQPQPPQPAPCPDPTAVGQPITLSPADLRTQRSFGVVAGGNLDLAACGSVPGHGHVIQAPDFSLTIAGDLSGNTLDLGIDGTCDPVMLVHDPRGAWHFNDDAADLNSRVTIDAPVPGVYRVWAGTFGMQTCQATLLAHLQPTVTADPDALPDPGGLTGYRDRVGQTFRFQVTGAETGGLWGTGTYTDDSRLARAAVHAGLLHVGQSGVVTVQILPGQDRYQGSDQNGAHSSSYGRWNGSYAFVETAPDPGPDPG